MTTLNVNITDKARNSLIAAAHQFQIDESKIITDLIENYLSELKEDMEDYNRAIKILEQNNKTTSWEEVQRELGLLEK